MMTRPALPSLLPAVWLLLGAILLGGLAVRIAAATGGLWIDEAWSVVFAHEASPVVGVFASIHHDNNHHLNTLWLQLVGQAASPLAMRGLAILSGTLSICVAAWIGFRRGTGAGLATAALFAFAPVMVLYGSEARGYAPMLLAVLLMAAILLHWLEDRGKPPPADALAIISGLGMLSHLLMAPALALLGGWVGLEICRKNGIERAVRDTVRVLAPAVIVSVAIIATILGSAHIVAGGLTVGSHTPFQPGLFLGAMIELTSLTTGIGTFGAPSVLTPVLAAVLFALLLLARAPMGQGFWLCLLLVFSVPLGVLLFQPGNSQFSRYYLLSAIGVLIFVGDRIGALIGSGYWRRWLGLLLLTIWVAGSLLQVRQLVLNQRGHSDQVIAQMAARLAGGSSVAIDNPRARAVLVVAAAQQGYPLSLRVKSCDRTDYWFLERERGVPAAARARRCDKSWRLIAKADAIGPSGQSWSLYAPQGLQSRSTVANSPLPAR